MNIKTRSSLFALLLSTLIPSVTRADVVASPAPELKKTVDAFAGTWIFDGSVTMGATKPKQAKSTLVCTRVAGGKAVSCIEDAVITDLGPMQSAFLIGYDTFGKRVHFMAMTSDEAVHDHPCTWRTDRVLECEPLKAGMNGAPITEDFSVVFGVNTAAIKGTVILPDGSRLTWDLKGRRK